MDEASLTIENDSFLLGIPFTKVNTEKRTVEGFATLDNVDKSREILDIDASKVAFAAWPGNIREMHQKKAVGKAINFFEKDFEDEGESYQGMWLQARISKGAEDTWQKVLDGTLTGFSVGGAIQEKQREMAKDASGYEVPCWRVTKYSLGEVSLVDNPCNGLASIQLIKSVDGMLEITNIVDDGELEKATTSSTVTQRPPMKGTQPMQGKEQTTVQGQEQAPEAPDDDMPLIQAVIKALNAWRDSESEEGDDHDIAFISSLIQQLKERVFHGDPGNTGNNNAVFGSEKTQEKPLKKDAVAEDDSTHPTVAYPAQHIEHARDHMRHFHAHAAKNGHMHLADQAHQMMKSLDYMCKDVNNGGYDSMCKAHDPKAPYGDVTYADPGYQIDKKKRYPIDTKEHVDAALSYIEQKENAAKYKPEDLAKIKANIHAATKKFNVEVAKGYETEGEILQNNTNSDISSVEGLKDEHQGILSKFVDFLKGIEDTEESVQKDGDNTEMDEKLVKDAIDGAVDELNKVTEDKFTQIGESLTKIAEALEAVAKTEALDEVKVGLETTIADLTSRLEALENSGATQKSADEAAAGEKLEKNDTGFWANNIVPEFAQARHKAGR